ncbi:MAG: carboxypeptidase-like regulatory domain-containing protein [Chitinophagales bacterium]|nr:carboxypeptidase-like regulatory domain-containing protein [Chitinophagales bacterium]
MKSLKANILILFLFVCYSVSAQSFIEGRVVDAKTKEAVGYANIYIKGTTIGTTTDDTGYYQLRIDAWKDSISAAYLGYNELTLPLKKTARQRVDFEIQPSENMLAEAVIVANRESMEDYLIRKILENKDRNDKRSLENYSYEYYSKIELDIKNLSDKFMDRKLLKPFQFVFNNIDSTSEEEPFLPIMLSENISDFFYTNKLNKKREVIKASKISGMNDASFSEFLGATYQDINIYDNAYDILQKQFISPIANSCKTFYRYRVIDTLVLDNIVHYKMMFEPKTKGDATFLGSLIVSENNFAIKSIQLRMAPHVNINFIKRIELNQDFEWADNQGWMLNNDHLLIEFAPLENKPAVIARKNAIYRNFKINRPYNDSMIDRLKEVVTMDELDMKKDQAFWDTSRFMTLTKNEAAVYHMIDTLKTVPAFKTYTDIINLVLTGYYPVGPIELGPILNLVSNNRLEGWRFRAGFRTNEKASKWMQAGGYMAYSLKDKRIKGGADLSFLIHKFPRQIIKASYVRDVNKMSRTTDLLSTDNFLNIIIQRKRPDMRLLYMEESKLTYDIEYKQGFSMSVTMQNRRIGQGLVPFRYTMTKSEGVMDTLQSLNQTELVYRARFGFGEKFLNKNSIFRSSLNWWHIPVLQLEYVYGIKGFLKSQYTYHKITVAFSDIIPIRTIGRFEMKFQAGKVFGKVPFLLSEVHDGNQTFAYSNTAFNLMNDYEYYSDHYLQWNFTHHFDGFFLNRIPGIRKLKLREVIHTRGVWGNASAANQQINHASNSFIRPLGKIPYVEVGFGLENILKFLRVDAMWRVTHRNQPKTYNWMITFGFNFNF